ncbi:MAG: nicotinate-nucleotide--dimethylbenzimidazole phosphoribosyltransferase [Candidatus Binataceae bacterium]
MSLIRETLDKICPLDPEPGRIAQARLDSLTKPPGSLGHLETIVRRYAAIRRDGGARRGRGAIAVFVADHGVANEGVSAFPQSVTVEMLRNIAGGGAAISVLARRFGYELRVIDTGVTLDTSVAPLAGVTYRRIGAGTRNLVHEPAMTDDQATRAIEIGVLIGRELAEAGVTMIGIGEMGIANSTAAAAILCAATGASPSAVAGRGTGLDDLGLERKIGVIEAALRLHRDSFKSAEALLAAVGGFDIAAMAGVCIAGAAANVPVIVDGYISTAAAVIAEKIYPGIFEYLFFSHRSGEGGHALILDLLKVRPILDLDLRLGEGTGAAIAMSVIEAALDLFHGMATFAGAGVPGKIR